METLLQDVRYALVTMKRNKGFTIAGLLTLALGIGATTAVFSIVYGVLWRPLPYPAPQRLVRMSEEHQGVVAPLPAPMLSNITYYAWSASSRTLERFAAYRARPATMILPDGAARVTGAGVTPSLFSLIGASPQLGRFFRRRRQTRLPRAHRPEPSVLARALRVRSVRGRARGDRR
jgi:putative ABC transport system permease protein